MLTVDLSHPLTTAMPVYPGDPAVSMTPALRVAEDGVAVAHLSFGSHSGTHLDAPSHTVEGGRTVDEIPLELLHGEAMILQVRVSAHHHITSADLSHPLPERLPRIVCVATGWDQYFWDQGVASGSRLVEHPHLSPAFARELWDLGARVLGVDTLSPDPSDAQHEDGLPVHHIWLGQDGVIVENLRGLTSLPLSVEVSFLPLPLVGVDGSPIRAIARIATDSAD